MAETIKGINVVIGAETTGLQKALGDVDKKSRDIQSELKQVEKLLKLDPSNTDLLAQKQKLLGDAVGATKEKLDRLKTAQEQVNEQFAKGDISEGQYRAFQREVIKTEEELKKLESKLGDINNKWKDSAKALDEFGNKSNDLGKKLTPVSAAAGAVGAGMIGLAVSAGQAADDINTLSKTTGLATDTIQKFKFASDIIDVSFETLSGSLTKLTRNMANAKDGSKETVGAFETLRVSFADNSGELRDNEAVFNDVIDALGKVKNETERDALAMKLFGKSAQDLNPLILGGSDALKQMGADAEAAGLILSQDALDSVNAFNDEIDILKATASGTFAEMGVTIGEVLLPVLQGLAENLKGAAAWMRGLDENTIKVILVIAGLVAGIAPLLIIIGQMSIGISSLIGLWAKLSVAAVAAGTTVGGLVLPFVAAAAAITAAIAIGVLLYKNWDEITVSLTKAWNTIKENVSTIWGAIIQFFQELPGKIIEFFTDLPENLGYIIGFTLGTLTKFGIDAVSWANTEVPKIIISIVNFFKGLPGKIGEQLSNTLKNFLAWASNMLITVAIEVPKITSSIVSFFSELPGNLLSIGENMVRGLWEGVSGMTSWLKEKIKDFASGIVQGMKDALGIHSPSTVFAGIGENISAGMAVGITSGASGVKSALDGLYSSVGALGDVNVGVNSGSGAGGTTTSNSYTFAPGSIVIDAKSIAEMQSVSNFFNRLPQVARAAGVRV